MSKRINITHWILTGLFSAFMLAASIPDIISLPEAIAAFQHLGYPTYLLTFIGAAKVLGITAIVIPAFPKIKEWAYAGLCFDLVGALYSAVAVGDPASSVAPALIGLMLLTGSYVFYHKKINEKWKHQTINY